MSETRAVLLVDDNEVFRERLAKAMLKRGFEVITAGDYEQGVAAAALRRPDLAVVDLRMPGRPGLELVRDLVAAYPQLRVVVLTGYGSIATAIDAMKLGATHYLTKPVDTDEILAAFDPPPPLEAEPEDADLSAPSLARVEWEHIHRVLNECGGNVSKAARVLGIHRRSLQRKLSRYPARR